MKKQWNKSVYWLISGFTALILLLPHSTIQAQTYIMNEDFSAANGTTPPVDWENNTISGTPTDVWHFDNPGARSINYPVSGQFAIFDSEAYSSGNGQEISELVSPFLDCSFKEHIILFFDHFFAGSGLGKVEVWDGSAWQLVDSFTDSTDNPQQAQYDISAWAGGNSSSRLRFIWEGDNALFWAIDNIKVLATLDNDAGISAISNPVMPFAPGLTEIKVNLSNFGYFPITSTDIHWKIDGIEQAVVHWTGNVPFNTEETDIPLGNYNFNSGEGVDIVAWQENPNGLPDENHQNDSTQKRLTATLCGTYTIGGSDGDFENFTTAVNALSTAGISCPVVFNVRSGVYDEQILLGEILGASAINTITFQSENGDSSSVTLTNSLVNFTLDYTLQLNFAEHIHFKRMSFDRGISSTQAIASTNSAHCSFSHCAIQKNIKLNSTDSLSILQSLLYKNLKLQNSNQHIFVEGCEILEGIDSENSNTNITITKNTTPYFICEGYLNSSIKILSNTIRHISVKANSYPPSTVIDNNTMPSNSGGRVAIIVEGNNIKSISNNRIHNILSKAALLIKATHVDIINNIIHSSNCFNDGSIHIAEQADSCRILFNTINQSSIKHSETNALYLEAGAEMLKIENNIFRCKEARIPVLINGNSTSNIFSHNNYFSTDGVIGSYNDVLYTDMAEWQAAIGGGVNSVEIDPRFASDSLMVPHHTLLNGTGLSLTDVAMDINNKIRSNPPDIGAIEFDLEQTDAGIDYFISPEKPLTGNIQDIVVLLRNQGTNPLLNATIQWTINDELQSPLNWTGNLGYRESAEIILEANHIFSGRPIYHLKAWSEQPNGIADIVPANDTAYLRDLASSICGIYTIGGEDPDFENFSEAAVALNQAGITCPVVFYVREGNYDEQIIIDSVAGSSEINTITFQPDTANEYAVILSYQSFSILDYSLKYNKAQYVHFKGIKIKKGEGATSIMMDQASHCSFSNCSVNRNFLIENSDSILLDNNTLLGNLELSNNNSFIEIINNAFTSNILNRYDCIFTGENAHIEFRNNIAEKLTIRNASAVNIHNNQLYHILLNATSLPKTSKITNNTIISKLTSHPAIIVSGNNISEISGNKIYDVTNQTGIYCLGNAINIINNSIETEGTGASTGISLSGSADSCAVLFNSIHQMGTHPTQSTALLIGGTISNLHVKNNILYCKNTGIPIKLLGEKHNISLDFNDYNSSSGKIGQINDSIYTDLNSWKTNINDDAHSITINPRFTSNSLLIPHHTLLNGAGQAFADIEVDIDSVIRSNPPDIGAFEFDLKQIDAGIDHFASPISPLQGSIHAIRVLLRNQGTENLTSADIQWTVNGVLQNTFNWTGNLAYKEAEEVTLDAAFSFLGTDFFHLKSWSKNPNHQTDIDPYNDTSYLNNLSTSLCGIYTIGGSDGYFENFTQAVGALNGSGITCPVIFDVRDGIYNEQIELGPIVGTSAINTVTFRSESGDSLAVLLKSDPSTNSDNFTLSLGNTQYVHFKNMSISREYSSVSVQTENSQNCSFEQCSFSKNILLNQSDSILILSSSIRNQLLINESNNNIAILHNQLSGNCIASKNNTHIVFSKNVGTEFKSTYTSNNFFEITFNTLTKINVAASGFPKNSVIDYNIINAGNNPGIFVSGTNIKSIIGNQVLGVQNNSGIMVQSKGTQIINNFVEVGGQGFSRGINLYPSADSCHLYFNTINQTGTNQTGSQAIAITAFGSDNVTNLIIKNNIFSCQNTGIPAYFKSDFPTCEVDYNDYYSPTGQIGYYQGTEYSDINIWGAAILGDANSKNLAPLFPASNNPQPYQRQLNGAGLPISGIERDLYGKLRHDQAPDMGAVEFMADFGLIHLLSPNLSCAHESIDSITVLIRQFGDIPFIDLKIAYQVNNGPIYTDTIEGSLNNDLMYTFREGINMSPQGDYAFKIWLIDVYDDNPNNDTLEEMRYSKPSPVVSFSATPGCAGTEIQFNGSATVGGGYFIEHYEWYFNDEDTSMLQNPLYSFDTGGVFPVCFRAYSNAGCYNDTSETIEIFPQPIAAFTLSESCLNDSNYFFDASQAIEGTLTSWQWSFGDGATANVQNTQHQYGAAGTYECQLIASNSLGCSDTIIHPAIVHQLPSAAFNVDTSELGQAAIFNDLSTSADGEIISWYWAFGDGTFSSEQNPQHIYLNPGNYTVQLSIQTEFGCHHSQTGEIVVIDNDVIADFTSDTICFGLMTHFTNLSSDNSSSWHWDFGNGNTSTEENPEFTFPTAGIHETILIAYNNNGVSDTAIKNIKVFALPTANFIADTACWGDSTSFTDLSTSNEGQIIQWLWDFGDPSSPVNSSTTQNPKHIYEQLGDYTAQLTVTDENTCLDQISKNVPSGKLPQAFAGSDTVICENGSLQLHGEIAEAGSWVWETTGDGSFEDPNSLNTQYIPGEEDLTVGSFNIIIHATASPPCQGNVSDTMFVEINELPFADAGSDTIICEGNNIPLFGLAQNYDNILWSSLGDGEFDDASLLNAIYTPGDNDINNLSVTLTLTAFPLAPCLNTYTDSINIHMNSMAEAHAGSDEAICSNNVFQTTGWVQYAGGLLWTSNGDGTFDDPSSSQAIYTPGIEDIDNGIVQLTLTAMGTTSCPGNASDSLLLTLLPQPIAHAGEDALVCENMSITMNGNGENAASYLWESSGDGLFSDAQELDALYTPGTQDLALGQVQLYLTANALNSVCDASTDSMTLNIQYLPQVFLGENFSTCSINDIHLEAQIYNASTSQWETNGDGVFDDPNSPHNVYHPGDGDLEQGFVLLWLNVQGISPCFEDVSDTIRIDFIPMMYASAGDDSEICAEDFIHLNGGPSNASSSLWSTTGDGTFSNPSALNSIYFPGANDINNGSTILILTVFDPSSDCPEDSDSLTLSISLKPQAAFNCPDVCLGTASRFYNQSSGLENLTCHWEFGDGYISSEQNPEHIYSEADFYTVMLEVKSNMGCMDTVYKTVKVIAQPNAHFDFENTCLGSPTQFHDLSTSSDDTIISWSWDFGDGNTSNQQNPEHEYSAASSYNIELIIETSHGCSDTYTNPIIITDTPQANFYVGPSCAGQATQFTDISTSSEAVITQWIWDFGDSCTATDQHPTHIFASSGDYEIRLIVQDENGCSNGMIQDLTVGMIKAVDLGPDTAICPGDELILDAGNYTTYLWQDGSTQAEQIVENTGLYWVEVTNDLGCISIDSIFIGSSPTMNISGLISMDGIVLSEAQVNLYNWNNGKPSSALDSCISDENGHYILKDINRCERYIISAYSKEQSNSIRTWYKKTPYWHQARIVDASLGINELENINIDLLKLYDNGFGNGLLCGNVRYDDPSKHKHGAPIEDADMYLQVFIDSKDNDPWQITQRTKTDNAGDYCFKEVNTGEYRIFVDIPFIPMDSMHYVHLYNSDTAIYGLDYIVDSTGIYIITTGIEDITGNEYFGKLHVWPNPNHGHFQLQFEATKPNIHLQRIDFLDISGKILRRDKIEQTINESFTKEYNLQLQSGVFILRFICDEFIVHKRIVVE